MVQVLLFQFFTILHRPAQEDRNLLKVQTESDQNNPEGYQISASQNSERA